MKKRMLARLLALILTVSLLSMTAGAVGTTSLFTDVTAADWFYDAVAYVNEADLMTGIGTRFAPNAASTRAQLWTILARLDGESLDRNTVDWYAGYQRWVIRNDISDGTDPNGEITREQLACMLYRYATRKGYVRAAVWADLSVFSDADAVSGYAAEAMQWAVGSALLNGMNGRLNPQGLATRAQVATLLHRLRDVFLIVQPNDAALLATVVAHTGLSICFDWEDTVTTQPTVTLGGSYVSSAEVASITYTLTGEYSDFRDTTGNVTYADGRWEITNLCVVPDSSTVTLVITDTNGNTASATGSVYYDLGELVNPELVKVAEDKETGLIFASNILLVYFAEDANEADKNEVVRSVGETVAGQDNFTNMLQLMVEPVVTLEAANQIADQVEEKFQKTVELAMFDLMVSEDSMVFNDPWENTVSWWEYGDEDTPNYEKNCQIYPEGWDDDNPGGSNWNFETIEASSAWELYGSEFKPVGVGVIDRGFDVGHEELQGKIIFPTSDAEERNREDRHGTHIAGTIAAIANNEKGITGIAHQATIIASPFKGSYSGIVQSFEELVKTGARVINLSYGMTENMKIDALTGTSISPSTSTNLRTAAKSAKATCYTMSKLLANGYDFVVVQSSGNGTKDGYACDAIHNGLFATISAETHKLYGSVALNQVLDRIMIVGSVGLNLDGSYTQYVTSNAGDAVCICAPGRQILSCTSGKSGYNMMGGTSMAAPHVAAVAALTWSANEYLTGAQVKQILCTNSNRVGKDNTREYSRYTRGDFPIVNARLSVKKALELKPITSDSFRAIIVEGPTANGMTAVSVSAYPSDYQDDHIAVQLTWGNNPGVYQTLIARMQAGQSFTEKTIQEDIAFYPNLWKEELGERPDWMPLEEAAINSFPWLGENARYPVYVLLLNMDREYNVLGYTIVKIEQA